MDVSSVHSCWSNFVDVPFTTDALIVLHSFILEGIMTALIGISTYWLLPNSPESSKFLNDYEKDVIHRRLQQDAGTKEGKVINAGEDFEWTYFINTILDWKLWLAGLIVCGQSIPFYAFSFFSPTIIKELGYKTWEAQLLTVPVYLLACAATLGVSIYADGCQTRWKFVVFPYSLAAIAFVALLAIPHPRYPGLTYGFLYLIPTGCKHFFPSPPPFPSHLKQAVIPPFLTPPTPTVSCGVNAVVAWVANNLAPSWRRAIGMALMTTIANFGGAIGANIYLAKQAPRYELGFGFSLAVLLTGILSALILKTVLQRTNAQRDRMSVEEIKEQFTEQQLLEMGDRSPLYRYVI